MVTIKVQSVDDIIKAYLQTLECCSTKKLSVLVPLLKNLLGNLDDKAVDVISLLDELVYKKSLTIFGNIKLTKSQMISLCKFCLAGEVWLNSKQRISACRRCFSNSVSLLASYHRPCLSFSISVICLKTCQRKWEQNRLSHCNHNRCYYHRLI